MPLLPESASADSFCIARSTIALHGTRNVLSLSKPFNKHKSPSLNSIHQCQPPWPTVMVLTSSDTQEVQISRPLAAQRPCMLHSPALCRGQQLRRPSRQLVGHPTAFRTGSDVKVSPQRQNLRAAPEGARARAKLMRIGSRSTVRRAHGVPYEVRTRTIVLARSRPACTHTGEAQLHLGLYSICRYLRDVQREIRAAVAAARGGA